MKSLLKTNDFLNKILLIMLFFLAGNIFSSPIFPPSYEAFMEEDFCDACGCSNNGGSLGMGGIIENNFIGVRYLHQAYESRDGIFKNSPKVDEQFNTVQIWSRIPVITNLEVQAFVSYHNHYRNYIDKPTKEIKGLGDILLLSNYTFLDKKQGNYDEKTEKVSMTNHILKAGLGIKLPTGKYNQQIDNSTNPSFQLGTGSVDYISSLQYVFKYNNFGVNNYINYYYKNSNKNKYRFGNQYNFNNTFFYVLKDSKKNIFIPSLSISGEFYDKGKVFGLPIENSNGYAIFSAVGVEYNLKKTTFGFAGVYPINQNLTQGDVEIKYRSSIYFNYNF